MDSTSTFDKLCSPCLALFDEEALQVLRRKIIFGQAERQHLSLQSLFLSVDKDCHLCTFILNSFRRRGKAVDEVDMKLQTMNSEQIRLSISFSLNYHGNPYMGIRGIDPKYSETSLEEVFSYQQWQVLALSWKLTLF